MARTWSGALLVVLLLAACAEGQVEDAAPPADGVWVVPDGSDAASGGMLDPVATLQRAVEIAGPGGTVRLLPGRHHGSLRAEGLATITIKGEPGAILDGEGSEPLGIFCEDCPGLIVEDLTITGFTDIGVGVVDSDGVTLRRLVVHGNGTAAQLTDWEIEGYGIHIEGCTEVVIEDTEAWDNGPLPGGRFILGTAINTYGNRGVVIRGNYAHDNRGAGILVEDSFDVVVEGNTITANDLDATAEGWWDGALWIDGGGQVTLRGNILRHNLGPAIQISDEDDQSPLGYRLTDNVVTDNDIGLYVWGFEVEGWPPEEVLEVSGNEISGNRKADVVLTLLP
ncbi:MAG: right-handed parallel beta-helix repeat-containing protein [Acidimicrobiia bacterium]|nr:MAG: right-handed parallel beta-helix repeat-containing protein [Acidimicrobiia bacterium]